MQQVWWTAAQGVGDVTDLLVGGEGQVVDLVEQFLRQRHHAVAECCSDVQLFVGWRVLRVGMAMLLHQQLQARAECLDLVHLLVW